MKFAVTLNRTATTQAKPARIHYRSEALAAHSYKTTLVTNEQDFTGVFEVEIDIDALCKFVAARAMFTKSGKSSIQDGLVVAKRKSLKPTSEVRLVRDRTDEYPADKYEVTLL